ncbi:MAG TPA: polysaccharide biosynthesis/export family protein [Vulgatibacter sp.]
MPSRSHRSSARWLVPTVLLLAIAGLSQQGCASTMPYVWVDETPADHEIPDEYRLSVRDVISVRVWNQDAISTERARVREDGRISLPFLRDVGVVGMTLNELCDRLQKDLQSFIVDPVVSVTLVEPGPLSVSVVGEVATAGTFSMLRPSGVLQAIAAAGGVSHYADLEGIYVLRRVKPTEPPTRIRFRYRDLSSGGTRASAFLLKSGDIVVVE